MSKNIDKYVECPFYIAERDDRIVCEGVINGTRSVQQFEDKRDKNNYENMVCCCNGGSRCVHYKIINDLYERGLRT